MKYNRNIAIAKLTAAMESQVICGPTVRYRKLPMLGLKNMDKAYTTPYTSVHLSLSFSYKTECVSSWIYSPTCMLSIISGIMGTKKKTWKAPRSGKAAVWSHTLLEPKISDGPRRS